MSGKFFMDVDRNDETPEGKFFKNHQIQPTGRNINFTGHQDMGNPQINLAQVNFDN